MAKYTILSLDGGGIRGVLSARLLERLDAARPGFLPRANLFAGTSTGSILAVGLAHGLAPADLVHLYKKHGGDIFHRDLAHEVASGGGLLAAKYVTHRRLDALRPYFGGVTLGEFTRHVFVATFQLDSRNPIAPDHSPPRRWQGKFFHNYPGGPYADQPALDVVMRSSAPPIYFPIYQGFIDGGVVANNPSMCALAQAINPPTGGQDLHDVVLLSLGTGTRADFLTELDAGWGAREWGLRLVDLFFDSGTGLADFQCRQLLGECYHRLTVTFESAQNIGLDAVNRIGELIEMADACDLAPALAFIDERWAGADVPGAEVPGAPPV